MNNLDLQCINAIRVLSADAIQKSNSGHPGLPLGAASMAYTLWTKMSKAGNKKKRLMQSLHQPPFAYI